MPTPNAANPANPRLVRLYFAIYTGSDNEIEFQFWYYHTGVGKSLSPRRFLYTNSTVAYAETR